jgi:hypothetical protein
VGASGSNFGGETLGAGAALAGETVSALGGVGPDDEVVFAAKAPPGTNDPKSGMALIGTLGSADCGAASEISAAETWGFAGVGRAGSKFDSSADVGVADARGGSDFSTGAGSAATAGAAETGEAVFCVSALRCGSAFGANGEGPKSKANGSLLSV